MNTIQEFEEWIGIPVNTMKTKQMTVDGIEANREIIEDLTYNNKPLPIAPESESVRYLGFWATPNGDMQAAKNLVYDRTLRAKESIQGHPLHPKHDVSPSGAWSKILHDKANSNTKALPRSRSSRGATAFLTPYSTTSPRIS